VSDERHDIEATIRARAAAPASIPPVRLLGDIACPWTYLALHALEQAFGAEPPLEWHPFLLNLGDLARQRRRLTGPVSHYAARMGVPFAPVSLAQPVDAKLVHAVLLAAADDGSVYRAARALFAVRFAEGGALVGERDVHATLAAAVDEGAATRWCRAAPAHLVLVERAARAARLAGVSEIPLAVIDNAFVIGGLQPPEAYRALVDLADIRDHVRG
jgi:predicted DsbA family dithiol-disulfide isomerase